MITQKAVKQAIQDTVARWRDTLLENTPIDVERAKKLLVAKSSKTRVFVVDTPMQFYIAQAIIRGRFSKREAKKECAEIGVDDAFIADLRKTGGCINSPYNEGLGWNSRRNTLAYTIQGLLHKAALEINKENRGLSEITRPDLLTSDLHTLYWPTLSAAKIEGAKLSNFRYKLGFNSRCGHRALYTHNMCISGTTADILNNDFWPRAHLADAVMSEIICRLFRKKCAELLDHIELMHCVPAVMSFNGSYLLLGKRPVTQKNSEGNLHSESGPAVLWADGMTEWYIDGHRLMQYGEMIVKTPEKLSEKIILEIENEEERRIAIERFGWDKYLTATGAKILDCRENWVDGTVEVLVAPKDRPHNKMGWRHEQEPLRMVLACRSTGRKYFLAVPNSELTKRMGEAEIKTCETAQKWFSNGATTKFLPYAQHELNIVGAS